ncbi:SidA/IucD/PvdA family monooxygenase [Candidatus Methylospira mobilis]|uniref:SidA/IucD/PvdA family monooxygenase n=1 Tax=Candidatus Methylospira mobilis TaxID=1808979 RepID=A0A5Q0BCS2_9GAMM|nr:FAD-dependent oxidoreductase [Candidatus Methylospira mobilis]QFY41610.1 SidA/IucD/PvdA family monooxygenase [Candidatus Methylospira mobilis]WNV05142.1 FAD-dependent oxidoreductase [Candidatus Methylospira mobilis]
MPHYKYLIIGAGMTAAAAIGGIREVDPQGSAGLIGADAHPPYNRPPLSKGLWKGSRIEQIWCKTEERNVSLHLARTAETLEAQDKRVTDDLGTVYTYDKLLLATGGTPRQLPFGGNDIIYFRTLDDYQRLRALSNEKQRFTVIGGGFIGSEIAAALAMNGKKVVMAFPGEGIGANVFPHDLSQFLNQYYREKGVEVLSGQSVADVKRQDGQLILSLTDVATSAQHNFPADGIVAGLGIEPNTKLAEHAGLAVENGIIVNEFLQAGHPDIHAAGDVANFYNPALDARLRLEHEDNALNMGRHAGRNMAGETRPYHYHASFYSDLFELGYEAVGRLDARMKTVADWSEPYRKGVVYYLQNERVKGVLLWNVWDRVPLARELIAQPGPFAPADLYGRL